MISADAFQTSALRVAFNAGPTTVQSLDSDVYEITLVMAISIDANQLREEKKLSPP